MSVASVPQQQQQQQQRQRRRRARGTRVCTSLGRGHAPPKSVCSDVTIARRSGGMAPSVWKSVVGVGLLALAHAAFSAAQHRSYMRLTEKESGTLPIDIVLQTLLAFGVTCCAVVRIAGEFRNMDASSELRNRASDTSRNRPSFYLFDHRGRVRSQPPGQEARGGVLSDPLRLRKPDTPHH
ncbi:membrane magnesium transporter 1 [Arapaima gigas]